MLAMAIEAQTDRHWKLSLGVVLLLAVLVRVWYLIDFSQLPYWTLLTVDNYYHHNWATTIAGGNILGDTTYFRAPFYVYCLALIYKVVGPSIIAARLFGQVVGLASILTTFLIGRRLFSNKVGLIGACIQAFFPIVIYMEAELLLDPLFMLLLQLAVWQFLCWLHSRATKSMALTGLFIGLAAITRPTGLLFVLVVLAATILWKTNGTRRLKTIATLLLTIGVVVGPITIRNLVVAGDPVLISSQSGINLYLGNNPEADGISAAMPEPLGTNWQIKDIENIARLELGQDLKPGEVSSFWTRKALAWITENPAEAFGLWIKKLYLTFCNTEIPNNRPLSPIFSQIQLFRFNPVSFGVLLPLALLGVFRSWRRQVGAGYLVVFTILYVMAISFFFVNARFRLPWLPYLSLFAACGATELLATFRTSRARAAAWAGGMIVVGFALWTPAVPLSDRPAANSQSSMGLYHYGRGEFAAALTYYQSARDISPDLPEANLNIGACFLRLSNHDSALYYFRREIEIYPERSKGYVNLASLHLVSGRLAEATTAVERGLALKPYSQQANLVQLRVAAADTAISLSELRQLIDRSASNSQNDLRVISEGASLLSVRGDNQTAERLAQMATEAYLQPVETDDRAFGAAFVAERGQDLRKKAEAYHLLGYINALRGMYGQAAEQSRRAIETDSLFREPYTNLIQSLIASGSVQAADSVRREIDRIFDH